MKKLLLLLMVFLFSAHVFAEIKIYQPQDNFTTFDETLMLQGEMFPPGGFYLNGSPFWSKDDGNFSCGLVLKPGKNLVQLQRMEEDQKIRLLKLLTFPDLEGTTADEKKHWARGQIIYLASLGVIEGYPDNNFYPANPVTRGEFATWLAKAKKMPIPQLTQDVFFDVPKEHWRAPYVKAVVDAGYMTPYSVELFGLDDPISRTEAAGIAVTAEGLGIVSEITPIFIDVKQEREGSAPIYTARQSGLVIGVSDKVPIYDPTRAITRAEAATLLSRFRSSIEGIQYLSDFSQGFTKEDYCALNVPPKILTFSIYPNEVMKNQLTRVHLRAVIASREAYAPLSKVTVDLVELGSAPDAEMYDDGAHGDQVKGDNIYSLDVTFMPEDGGEKLLTVKACDKLGWESCKSNSILVLE